MASLSHASPLAHAADIVTFWFGTQTEGPWSVDPDLQRRWFVKDAAFDAEIAQRFGGALEAALAMTPAPTTPGELLASVLLLDQFTRNSFRGTARMFAGDPGARALARQALHEGWDQALRPIERVFLYLPFEHSEAAEDQAESLRLFGALAEAHPSPFATMTLDYARQHAVVIERFGRYPHRNAALGRESTAEEVAFLATPGSSF